MAEPGGICISRAVRDQIRDKLLYELEDLGEQELKNIARPVRVFRVSIEETGDAVGAKASAPVRSSPTAAPVQPAAPSNGLWQGIAGASVVIAIAAICVVTVWQPWVTRVEAANVANMVFPLPDKPSLVVLPFDNLSGDPDQDFLGDGLSEDITTALSRTIRLFVISRATAFTYKGRSATAKQVAEDLGVQYVIEGSVQRDGDQIRVNAQLIDALSGRHIWANTYDRDVNDLFAVKDEITLNIVSSVGAEVSGGYYDLISRRETNSLEAWSLFREGVEEIVKLTPEALENGRHLSEQALEHDPDFLMAKTNVAYSHIHEGTFGYSDPATSFRTAHAILAEVLEAFPSHAYSLGALALLYVREGQLDLGVETARAAIALSPNETTNHPPARNAPDGRSRGRRSRPASAAGPAPRGTAPWCRRPPETPRRSEHARAMQPCTS